MSMVREFLRTEAQKDTANFFLQAFVATAVVLMTAVCLWVIATFDLKERNFSALQLFLGAALAWMGGLMSFCFPSSIGAARDKETIAKLADKAPPPTGEALESLRATDDPSMFGGPRA